METGKLIDNETWLFAVLVPHRDCLPALELYRKSLFSSGMDGGFSFPAAAPLALLYRPLNKAELKNAATELRRRQGEKHFVCIEQKENSIFKAGHNNAAEQDNTGNTLRFFGPSLELPCIYFPDDSVLQQWKIPILAPAILAPGDNTPNPLPQAPNFSFRAAALANLCFSRELSGFDTAYSFSWELGPLQWLPKRV